MGLSFFGGQIVLGFKWLFSRGVYFTNGLSFSISRILIVLILIFSRIELVLAKFLKCLENICMEQVLIQRVLC